MDGTDPTGRDGVSRLSRRGLLALGATLAGTSGIGMFSGSAAAHELMAFRDAFVGDDADKQGLGSKGWLFFAKDTGTVYYHNGSSWVDLGIGGGDGGSLTDEDDDGLLEAPNHDGIDVEQVEAESVSAGEVDINGASIISDSFTVPDDDTVRFGNGEFERNRYGFLIVKVSNTESSAVVADIRNGMVDLASNDITVLSGQNNLQGTTGTDGEITLSRFYAESKIENRSGSEITVEVFGCSQ